MVRGLAPFVHAFAWPLLIAGAPGRNEDIGIACGRAPHVADGSSMLQLQRARGEAGSGESRDDRRPPSGGSDLDLSILLDEHSEACHTVYLTNVFTTRPDPQGKRKGVPDFTYFERYYRSILSLPTGRASAVILYDSLPEDLVRNYSTGDDVLSFRKVDISKLDPLMGLNDLRFLVFEEEVKKHPEWSTIFMTDIRDVLAIHNPCMFVKRHPEKIFVGSQPNSLKPYWVAAKQFGRAGGKYLAWYTAQPDDAVPELNAGLIGGRRPVVLKVLSKIIEVLLDPETTGRKERTNVTINMPAVNYGIYTNFGMKMIVTGRPLHSEFRGYENRTDVYFWHK